MDSLLHWRSHLHLATFLQFLTGSTKERKKTHTHPNEGWGRRTHCTLAVSRNLAIVEFLLVPVRASPVPSKRKKENGQPKVGWEDGTPARQILFVEPAIVVCARQFVPRYCRGPSPPASRMPLLEAEKRVLACLLCFCAVIFGGWLVLSPLGGVADTHQLETMFLELEEELEEAQSDLREARAEASSLREALRRAGVPSPALSANSSSFYGARHSSQPASQPHAQPKAGTAVSTPAALEKIRDPCAGRPGATARGSGPRPIPGGDLEASGVLEAAFAARAVEGELIFLSVGDTRDHRRVAKDPALKDISTDFLLHLLANLRALGRENWLILSTRRLCGRLQAEHCERSCVWSTLWDDHPGLEPWRLKPGDMFLMWAQQWRYVARALELGYRVFRADTDVYFAEVHHGETLERRTPRRGCLCTAASARLPLRRSWRHPARPSPLRTRTRCSARRCSARLRWWCGRSHTPVSQHHPPLSAAAPRVSPREAVLSPREALLSGRCPLRQVPSRPPPQVQHDFASMLDNNRRPACSAPPRRPADSAVAPGLQTCGTRPRHLALLNIGLLYARPVAVAGRRGTRLLPGLFPDPSLQVRSSPGGGAYAAINETWAAFLSKLSGET